MITTGRWKLLEDTAVYHCTVRMVEGLPPLDADDKSRLVEIMRLVADFSGVKLFTYAVMDDHFHVLVSIPKTIHMRDAELMRRYRMLYPNPNKYHALELDAMEQALHSRSSEAAAARDKIQRRMGDISSFMKDMKQRFCLWHNKRVGRSGTLWAERFKSLLVENANPAVEVVAAYIDLNPVRAGLVENPADYPFSGYGAACAGDKAARHGISALLGRERWPTAQKAYVDVFDSCAPGERPLAGFNRKTALKAIAAGEELPLPWVLRCRVRYFSDGAVIGSAEFVQKWYEDHKSNFPRRKDGPRKMEGSHWQGLTVFRDLKKNVFG